MYCIQYKFLLISGQNWFVYKYELSLMVMVIYVYEKKGELSISSQTYTCMDL